MVHTYFLPDPIPPPIPLPFRKIGRERFAANPSFGVAVDRFRVVDRVGVAAAGADRFRVVDRVGVVVDLARVAAADRFGVDLAVDRVAAADGFGAAVAAAAAAAAVGAVLRDDAEVFFM